MRWTFLSLLGFFSLFLPSCSTETPQTPLEVVSVYSTPSATPWLTDLYACAESVAIISRTADPSAAGSGRSTASEWNTPSALGPTTPPRRLCASPLRSRPSRQASSSPNQKRPSPSPRSPLPGRGRTRRPPHRAPRHWQSGRCGNTARPSAC